MSKLFHVAIGIVWFYMVMSLLELFEQGNFGLFHVAAMFLCGGVAFTQVKILLEEAADTMRY
jgi:hypothetical protein